MAIKIKDQIEHARRDRHAPADLYNYDRMKSSYLSICRRHGLNPFDLDIASVTVSGLPQKDKASLVRLMLNLIGMEKRLKHIIRKGLFPLTVRESERSGYLIPTPCRADGG